MASLRDEFRGVDGLKIRLSVLILEQNEVAYLVLKSVKIFWLACFGKAHFQKATLFIPTNG